MTKPANKPAYSDLEKTIHELEIQNAQLSDQLSQSAAEAANTHMMGAIYRAISDALTDIIIVNDEDGRYVRVMTGENSYLYKPAEQLEGRLLNEIFPQERADFFLDHIRQAIQTGEIRTFEYELDVPAGKRYFETRMSPIKNRTDGKKLVVGLSRDITERKRLEEALRESKDHLDNIINAVGYPIFVKDDNYRFAIANDALCDMLGIGRENIIGKTLGESLPKDQMDHFLEIDRVVLSSGQENQCEEYLTGRDGKILTIITKKTRYIDQRGNKFLVGAIHDISVRKQAEDALVSSEAKLRALFAAMTDVVIVYDADGRYIEIAPTNPSKLYRPSNDMLGKTLYDVLPRGQADYLHQRILEAVHTGHVVNGEYELIIADQEIWFACNISRLSDNMVVLVAHDITNRKKVEAQLLELSVTDKLTGLFNYRHFSQEFPHEIARARRLDYPLSLLILDIDHFHGYNNTYGHRAGNDVLQWLGQLLTEETRKGVDICARYGGEELVVGTPGIDLQGAESLAERLRELVAAKEFLVDQDITRISVSVGAAQYTPDIDLDFDTLFIRADLNLYAAKDLGRNHVVAK